MTLVHSRKKIDGKILRPERKVQNYVVDDDWLEEVSPFGLQGLRREEIQILQADRVSQLAATLALSGTKREIRDSEFVARILSRQPGWVENYQIVHLIERSLWISGRSDLVMTLTRNPSQIPDNPPPRIMQALTRAYAFHPQATIWYGVPLFSDETNAQGLPIPMTAEQVRAEHIRRVSAAQAQALRWRWLYRGATGAIRAPGACWRATRLVGMHSFRATAKFVAYCKQARRDARIRAHAKAIAHMEYCRTGRSWTEIPQHTTLLGQITAAGAATVEGARDSVSEEIFDTLLSTAGALGLSGAAMTVAQLAPTLFIPLTIVATDPFLFVELPDEPGKLRHLGHWYWQGDVHGKKKLHLHI